jgi:soluble lytic murein transglycosylase-like protein
MAEALKPAFGGDFTFRRVKPPTSGATKRITIQIAPDANPFPQITPKKSPTAKLSSASDATMGWFWDEISPLQEASGPGRFVQAVEHIGKAPFGQEVSAPRLDALYKIAETYGTDILAQTIGKNISPAFVLSVISVESGGRVSAESNKGAQGLMQLIPATAERFGVTDSNDPIQNIKGGVAYLEWLLNEFDGDPILALAGYNAGEGAVRSNKGVPPYAETRAYVPKVLAAWRVVRTMCLTQPELFSDGCVFRQKGSG